MSAFLTYNAFQQKGIAQCRCGEIGIHDGFKIRCLRAWRFKSAYRYHILYDKASTKVGALLYLEIGKRCLRGGGRNACPISPPNRYHILRQSLNESWGFVVSGV